jgi:cobyrinic acid a,c-diamide synthase
MFTNLEIPRIVTAALRGGAGKTLVTVGLIAALEHRGRRVATFKKGPDYIDAGWLTLAGSGQCRNLDTFLFTPEDVKDSFLQGSTGKELAIIEGNRGLFDGVDHVGSYSTAEMAKLLKSPVILILDASKMTGTAAALVRGCLALDPELNLKAVILNRTAGIRHEKILTEAIENACPVEVIGCIRKLDLENFPQRHLGLLPVPEHPGALEFVGNAAKVIEGSVDLEKLLCLSGEASRLTLPEKSSQPWLMERGFNVRIGIIRDSAFQFYYPENLKALEDCGAQLVTVNSFSSRELPDVDCVYIGGGFPETHAESLAGNEGFKKSLRLAAERGLPIYAECGGLMFLSRNLRMDEKVFPMCGVFPVDAAMERKPQGLGYISVETVEPNPFYPVGVVITGHEFHYSSLTESHTSDCRYAFKVLRGRGIDGMRDGIVKHNTLGTYLHAHVRGTPMWANSIVRQADEFRRLRLDSDDSWSKEKVS